MTQTWRFTEEGRLCCAHNNMCVQAKDGFFGLRPGQFPIHCTLFVIKYSVSLVKLNSDCKPITGGIFSTLEINDGRDFYYDFNLGIKYV